MIDMVSKIWIKGESAKTQLNDISTIVAGVDINPITQKIIDNSEQYEYDDANLSPPQRGQLIAYFSGNGWTDVSP